MNNTEFDRVEVPSNAAQQSVPRWRLALGIIIFLLSIILPLAGIPAVAAFELSATAATTVSGALLVGAEILGILAAAVMGKPGYLYIRSRIFAILKQYGPPRDVGRGRYRVGLVMFALPIVFAWISVYSADYIPGYSQNPLPYAIGGDLLLLASLFVLGGDFWDKIRALFAYDAEVHFP